MNRRQFLVAGTVAAAAPVLVTQRRWSTEYVELVSSLEIASAQDGANITEIVREHLNGFPRAIRFERIVPHETSDWFRVYYRLELPRWRSHGQA